MALSSRTLFNISASFGMRVETSFVRPFSFCRLCLVLPLPIKEAVSSCLFSIDASFLIILFFTFSPLSIPLHPSFCPVDVFNLLQPFFLRLLRFFSCNLLSDGHPPLSTHNQKTRMRAGRTDLPFFPFLAPPFYFPSFSRILLDDCVFFPGLFNVLLLFYINLPCRFFLGFDFGRCFFYSSVVGVSLPPLSDWTLLSSRTPPPPLSPFGFEPKPPPPSSIFFSFRTISE